MLQHLGAIGTVVDIGANRGQFALVARHCYPSAHIISFEPLPDPAEVFRAVFNDDRTVVLHEAAIGPEESRCVMHVSGHDDSSSLLSISALQSKIFPGTAEVSTIEVQVAPLENFIQPDDIIRPALLKLDVQGYEFEALVGSESLLSRFDFIYCECSFVELYTGQKLAADVVDWLSSRGFEIKGMYNSTYDADGQSVQADILFQRSWLRV
ncbi:MAG: hypothetical protein NPIRA05_04990 [Nitrospirales bacterium]|nr:MAG: hypothetical protein NPIRA05_04990 [Nitrospirales bacterium]